MVKTSHIFSATIFYFRVDIYMPATHLLQILIAEQQCKKGNAKAKKKKKEEEEGGSQQPFEISSN